MFNQDKPPTTPKPPLELASIDMGRFRSEIQDVILGRVEPLSGKAELRKVTPAALTQADARMWYIAKDFPGQFSHDMFRDYEAEVRVSGDPSREFFRIALAGILTAQILKIAYDSRMEKSQTNNLLPEN